MPDPAKPNNTPALSQDISALLGELQPEHHPGAPLQARKAVVLARLLQRRAMALQTAEEKRQQAELERMMHSPHDKATLMQMTDQALRSHAPVRAVDQLVHILDVQGIPRFFSGLDKALLKGFQSFGSWLPGVAVPMMQERMRQESANVILPAEEDILTRHLRERQQSGVRMNVNFLGEALLGEQAAAERMAGYLRALQQPELECLSIKISTIFSQISSLAWENSVATLCDRLEQLYREADSMRYTRPDGLEVPKFVYLDMEEYRDMSVTAEAFMRTLDRAGMEHIRAGIALQAYLPDAWEVQKRINEWARRRVAAGNAPVTIRLVKGANLEMERVEASIAGWPQAPYKSKQQVDANYKRMLHEGMQRENLAAVHLGVASHNLFDLAYGLVLATEAQAEDKVQFEMLEGMANHQRRALFEVTRNLLLYAPATRQEQFIHAIGYLVRRLDENTGPDNFLSHAFKLEVNSDKWRDLEEQFLECFSLIDALPAAPRRTQDRRQEPAPAMDPGDESMGAFRNEPDTDFALPQNVEWAHEIIARWKGVEGDAALDVPLVIAGCEILDDRVTRPCVDPSRPDMTVGRYREANADDLAAAVTCASQDPANWGSMPERQRFDVLGHVAQELRRARGDLIGAAMADGGKTISESDPEVSEAIDFVEFYRRSAMELQQIPTLAASPRGVIAVVPPWNFPIAIPCGGVAAALAAGNRVILKPASNTVLVAYELCKCFWRGGVPREALQFMPCRGSDIGRQLVAHPDVDTVILTGGTDTALAMLDGRPDMNLLAETGGKDATIVTAMADRDQAIKHLLHSAFSHSGQKCSATSLLILEKEVYRDPGFRRALCDAVESLPVGSAWDTRTRIGPMISPPSGALERGLKVLDPGETWAVTPHADPANPCIFSPGVKWGVQPGSFMHMTELFGPVLAVMEADDLEHAIELVNQTGYGLTSGIESLDDREQKRWRDGVRAGNLYINRVTTGAIVLRQPFGGMGKSAFGPGIKAGGPNYVAQLMHFQDRQGADIVAPIEDPLLREMLERIQDRDEPLLTGAQLQMLGIALASYERAWKQEFGREHDHFRLLGQDNIRRYLPVGEITVRIHREDTPLQILAMLAAGRIAGNRITVSAAVGEHSDLLSVLRVCTRDWGKQVNFVEQSDADLARAVIERRVGRLRFADRGRASKAVLSSAATVNVYVAQSPVLLEGRIELLWYLQEQSISDSYHRYGNLGEFGARNRSSVS